MRREWIQIKVLEEGWDIENREGGRSGGKGMMGDVTMQGCSDHHTRERAEWRRLCCDRLNDAFRGTEQVGVGYNMIDCHKGHCKIKIYIQVVTFMSHVV